MDYLMKFGKLACHRQVMTDIGSGFLIGHQQHLMQ
jgi:hypothetical protein